MSFASLRKTTPRVSGGSGVHTGNSPYQAEAAAQVSEGKVLPGTPGNHHTRDSLLKRLFPR